MDNGWHKWAQKSKLTPVDRLSKGLQPDRGVIGDRPPQVGGPGRNSGAGAGWANHKRKFLCPCPTLLPITAESVCRPGLPVVTRLSVCCAGVPPGGVCWRGSGGWAQSRSILMDRMPPPSDNFSHHLSSVSDATHKCVASTVFDFRLRTTDRWSSLREKRCKGVNDSSGHPLCSGTWLCSDCPPGLHWAPSRHWTFPDAGVIEGSSVRPRCSRGLQGPRRLWGMLLLAVAAAPGGMACVEGMVRSGRSHSRQRPCGSQKADSSSRALGESIRAACAPRATFTADLPGVGWLLPPPKCPLRRANRWGQGLCQHPSFPQTLHKHHCRL